MKHVKHFRVYTQRNSVILTWVLIYTIHAVYTYCYITAVYAISFTKITTESSDEPQKQRTFTHCTIQLK